jgi:hypothetical protein
MLEKMLIATLFVAVIWPYLRRPTTWLILLLGGLSWNWLLG